LSSYTFLSTAQKRNGEHIWHTFVCQAVDVFMLSS
jgi:hypothetical protein